MQKPTHTTRPRRGLIAQATFAARLDAVQFIAAAEVQEAELRRRQQREDTEDRLLARKRRRTGARP